MTVDAMKPERFARLVEAYGADPARWPAAERAGALVAAAQPHNAALLAEAAMLDGWLDCYEVRLPGAALIHAVAAGAPQPVMQSRRAALWWPGLGLAGVGAVGVVVGALVVRSPAFASAVAGERDSYTWSYDPVLDGADEGTT